MRRLLTLLSLAAGVTGSELWAQQSAHRSYQNLRVVRAATCPRSDSLMGRPTPTKRPAVVRGIYRPEPDSTMVTAVDAIRPGRLQRFHATVRFAGWLPDSIPDVAFALFIPYGSRGNPPQPTDSILASLDGTEFVAIGLPARVDRYPDTPREAPDAYELRLSAAQFRALAQARNPSYVLGRYRWDFTDDEQASFQALFQVAACSLDPTNR